MRIPFFKTGADKEERKRRDAERSRLHSEAAQCMSLDRDISELQSQNASKIRQREELDRQLSKLERDERESSSNLATVAATLSSITEETVKMEKEVAELKKQREAAAQSVKLHLIKLEQLSSTEGVV